MPGLRPEPRALVVQARAALAGGDRPRALAILSRAAELFPDLSPLQVEFGNISLMQGDVAAAEAAYRRAIATDTKDAAAHVGLGNALRDKDEPEQAIAVYRRAAELAPGLAAIWHNLGLVLREVGRYQDAVAAYDRALATEPDRSATWYNKANALTAGGRYADAVAAYEEALRLKPDYPEAIFSQSMALLLAGDFARGWDLYEARWRARTFASPYRFARLPRWQGESLSGKHLLVWGEQGIGDEIRFLSILGEILGQARAVSYVGEQRLNELLARAFPSLLLPEMAGGDQDLALTGIDLQTPVGSLARFHRRSLDAFPEPRPFLAPDPELRDRWGQWLQTLGAGAKIGISWRTGRNARRKQARYAPLDAWGRFLDQVPACWICLQYDDCDDDIAAFARRFGAVVHVPPGLDRRDDFAGMAGLYAALDAVVAAPNTVADLAGALGISCWVVTHAPHWPWGVWPCPAGRGQPWYANLTMVDARALGGWPAAFGEVAAALAGASSAAGQISRAPPASR
jgi:tetratricopeptide (TPR) repeat protein